MKRTNRLFTLIILAGLTLGCNNFFHELLPPDGNRIISFRVARQQGEAVITDTTVTAFLEPEAPLSLIPELLISPEASLLPLTLDYIARAFPSVNILQEVPALYSTDDLSAYTIDLIKRNPDFNVPALDQPIDFSGPVSFLVVGGMGTIRRYTVYIGADTGTAKLLGFGFSKYDNPELVRDALSVVNETTKTAYAYALYPAEYTASYQLVPSFELLGETVKVDGVPLLPGGAISFSNSPGMQNKTLTVERSGYPAADYALTVLFSEDPESIRSIIDFRFTRADNPDLAFDAVAAIVDNGDRGTIRVQAMYRGVKPLTLTPRFISPGTVRLGGVVQSSGTSQDFSGPLEYQVISRNGLYTRLYTVQVELVDLVDSIPRISSFRFNQALNPDLVQDTVGVINDAAGRILIDVHYGSPAAPDSLIPEFTAGGLVKVTGMVQSSGAGAQNFLRQIKYSVISPDDPTLTRDYWVEARFIRDTSSDAIITAFSFHPDKNPALVEEAVGRIDQTTGQIYVYVPFGTNISGTPLVPRFSARGRVTVGGLAQESGSDSHSFNTPVVYEVESANGINHKSYTVTVQEPGNILYVKEDAAGLSNGSSWEHAFINLQQACETAALLPDSISKEIWIAGGTYRPADSAAHFPLTPNTSYIGGFGGWETSAGQRNPAANPVTITGDFGAQRSRLFYGATITGDLTFRDLHFTKAKAPNTGSYPVTYGAAISVNTSGRVEITNCSFTDMEANIGVAVYIQQAVVVNISNVSIDNTRAYPNFTGGGIYIANATDTTISGLTITNAQSGGLYIHNNSSWKNGNTVISGLTITNVQEGGLSISNWENVGNTVISGLTIINTKGSTGGGAYIQTAGSLSIEDAEISSTTSTNSGGGLYISSSKDVVISGLTIDYTKAMDGLGGGAYISARGKLTIENTKISNTENTGNGGGLYVNNIFTQATVISGLTITNAKGSTGGGAYISTAGKLTIEDTEISNTESTGAYGGGGLYVNNTSSQDTVISGLTITNTKATQSGGGAYIRTAGSLSIKDAEISSTESTDSGGGAYISYQGSLSIMDTDISNTKSTTNGGGGLVIAGNAGSSTTDISHLTITGANATGLGKGAFVSIPTGGSLVTSNTVINGTPRNGTYGAGYYYWD